MKKVVKPKSDLHELPCLPLRDLVLFPGMSTPIFVGRPGSIAAIEAAKRREKLIVAVTQKDPTIQEPSKNDLYETGCIAEIGQVVRMPDSTLKVLVEGKGRARIENLVSGDDLWTAVLRPVLPDEATTPEIEALQRNVSRRFEEYVRLSQKVPMETALSILHLDDPSILADAVASHLVLPSTIKQTFLDEISVSKRLFRLSEVLEKEIEISSLENKIRAQVRKQMETNQKEYYLGEQMKAIQKEMGKSDGRSEDFETLRANIEQSGMPAEVKEKAEKELARLEKMPPLTPETTVARTYLGWLIDLPWTKRTSDNLDLTQAKEILDDDHYGLEKPKERILEYLAVCKLAERIKGPILCLVGPPGVGKTSLGKSIARAMGREFVRMSLGGVRDEAEIRGHRRTYVGSMPGRILQLLAKAKVKNPVFLLDEVDKMSVDFRGDPSSALLEVLDPEQNKHFVDHYLEVGFDLSDCLFITTANVKYSIPYPLLDRMEVIELPGYTEPEKIRIAKQFLVPKQLSENGLTGKPLKLADRVLQTIIRRYTNEAGVRDLERNINKVLRQTARKVAEGKKGKRIIGEKDIPKMLGVPQIHEKKTLLAGRIEAGTSAGLAWTERGGDLLLVEVALAPGRGHLLLTGRLGEVMKESGMAALTFARRIAGRIGLKPEIFRKNDFHIHVAEGAIPKDGPSAGITIASALLSALLTRPLPPHLAMTGEITLLGRILPIGGLREKLLAAQRYGVRRVILPKENEPQISESPAAEIQGLKLHYVESMEDALSVLFPNLEITAAAPAIHTEAQGQDETVTAGLPVSATH